MILNDFPLHFGRRTPISCIIKEVIDIFHTYQIECAFGGDITCAIRLLGRY